MSRAIYAGLAEAHLRISELYAELAEEQGAQSAVLEAPAGAMVDPVPGVKVVEKADRDPGLSLEEVLNAAKGLIRGKRQSELKAFLQERGLERLSQAGPADIVAFEDTFHV